MTDKDEVNGFPSYRAPICAVQIGTSRSQRGPGKGHVDLRACFEMKKSQLRAPAVAFHVGFP